MAFAARPRLRFTRPHCGFSHMDIFRDVFPAGQIGALFGIV
jgi:hypothetical protein